jgi:uncharacterized protein
MNRISLFVKSFPLVTFFILAYGLSWGSYYLLSGPVLFAFGSITSALIVASITQGTVGLKELLTRCLRWRVGLKWYAAAIFIPIVIALSTTFFNFLLGASMQTTDQLSTWYNYFLFFPIVMIDAPIWEDSGWRGYAMPRFPANRSQLSNSIILGLLLAGWHLPIALSGGSKAIPYLIATIASAVVTNWVYFNARESALLAILYHTSANSIGLFLSPMFSEPDLVSFFWLLAAVNCVVAVVVQLIPTNSKANTVGKIFNEK